MHCLLATWQFPSFYFWNYVAHDKNDNHRGDIDDADGLSGVTLVVGMIFIFINFAPIPIESALLSTRLWIYYYHLQYCK